MSRLDGKVAIITGAAGGIGAAAVSRFSAEGAAAVATDAAELADGLRHDVTSPDDWERVVGETLERHGRIDVLVNNAGIFLAAPLADTPVEAFRRVQDVNVTGVFLGMQAVLGPMREQGEGAIVNVSSVAGLMGTPLLSAYAASKWAVRGMTKVAAKELARTGIRVNSVHPGQIDTAMNDRQRDATPELMDRLVAAIPMRRIGTPDEVVDALVYLASDESRYVTGAELAVDGGTTA